MECGEIKDELLAGLEALSRGKESAALERFAGVLGRCGDSAAAALSSARILLARGDPLRASVLLQSVTLRDPGVSVAHAMLGQALFGLHRNEEAIRSFRTALSLDPGNSEATIALDELLNVQEP